MRVWVWTFHNKIEQPLQRLCATISTWYNLDLFSHAVHMVCCCLLGLFFLFHIFKSPYTCIAYVYKRIGRESQRCDVMWCDNSVMEFKHSELYRLADQRLPIDCVLVKLIHWRCTEKRCNERFWKSAPTLERVGMFMMSVWMWWTTKQFCQRLTTCWL